MWRLRRTLRISGVIVLGPREEKAAMNGAGFVPSSVFGLVMYPSGDLEKISVHVIACYSTPLTRTRVKPYSLDSREDMRVRYDFISIVGIICENHTDATSLENCFPLLHSCSDAAEAHNDLPCRLRRV
ncbi:hypothetical protein GW17_00031201 [Ensete ventricosum]|nr:hypothetical protein GW17_00031201 [Ensete ventricosum]RZR78306.1 hypothetical protein BHM03_00003579 [Ensete ventricosum]